jgi:hypothetical protein
MNWGFQEDSDLYVDLLYGARAWEVDTNRTSLSSILKGFPALYSI